MVCFCSKIILDESMRIGIDIDGVLTNVEEFEIDYGSKYLYESGMFNKVINNIDFKKEDLNIDENIGKEVWSKAIYDYIEIPPRNFAGEIIKKLKKKAI